ncbi:MAG TPA: penicillin-binding protein 2 [Candidatus Angelobacter sp.]|nr:penicillin-binding protein 2 [Candidatus Angelobacter sp.]
MSNRSPHAPSIHASPAPALRRDDVVQLEGNAKRAIETGRTRLLVAGALFAVAYLVIAVRLAVVTLLSDGAEPRLAALSVQPVPIERGEIVDRNGVVLATNLATSSLYANPQQIMDVDEAVAGLTGLFPDLRPNTLREKLTSGRSFEWLRRNLTPHQQYAVNRLGLPGLYFQEEDRRVYPQGRLTAHVTGFTDIDNHGLAGIEQAFDDVLREGHRQVALSLDIRIQNIVREETAQAVADFHAIGGAGMVLDIETGELLAMVSLPDFDPNSPGDAPDETRFNRNTLGVYEMGSTFKLFTTAMALDSGTIALTDSFDAVHPIRIGRHTIHDFHPEHRWLTVSEIIKFSSNLGAARIAEKAGTVLQKDYMARFGMLKPVRLELPELGLPLYPGDWKPINTLTIAYGQGIAVTPLHLIAGVAGLIDGGVYRPVTIMKRDASVPFGGRRVIGEKTSNDIRQLMRLVVESGTGKSANVPGYLVGGKTGTAQKQLGKGYATNARLTSFIAAFPMNAPRYAILIIVDEPKPNASSHGYATAGWVAAPAVGRVIQRMAPLLGIEPIPDEAPEAQSGHLVPVSATTE